MRGAAADNDTHIEKIVFLNHFNDLPDPRQRGKIVYPLNEVLLLTLLAVLAGADPFVEIARFGEPPTVTEKGGFPELWPLVLGVQWERVTLRKRIEMRLLQRLDAGMVDEVRGLAETGISRERLGMFGMEYKHIAHYLAGEVEYDTMVMELLRDICRLAKRQVTWFRGMERRGTEIHWVPEASIEAAMKIIKTHL